MSANLRAFLFLIRWCEGTSDENGYRALYGHRKDKPKLFDSFADHPRISFDTPWGKTSASGAFQFLAGTWDDCKQALNLPDFSPESQDKAAVWLIQRRGALHAVEQGDLDNAIHLCNKEWASLPGSPYGQPTRSMDSCRVIFERAGGTLLQRAASGVEAAGTTQPQPATSTQAAGAHPPQGSPDGLSPQTPAAVPPAPRFPNSESEPNIMPLPVSVAVGLATELWRILRPTQKVAEIAGAIDKAAPALLEAAKKAVPNAVNEQQAVEQIRANPQLQAAFRAQAVVKWDDLSAVWEAEEKSRREARQFAADITSGDGWRAIGAGFIIGLLSLIVIAGGGVMFYQFMHADHVSSEQKAMILGALLAGFTAVISFWFGSSASSRVKDQTIADQARR